MSSACAWYCESNLVNGNLMPSVILPILFNIHFIGIGLDSTNKISFNLTNCLSS